MDRAESQSVSLARIRHAFLRDLPCFSGLLLPPTEAALDSAHGEYPIVSVLVVSRRTGADCPGGPTGCGMITGRSIGDGRWRSGIVHGDEQ